MHIELPDNLRLFKFPPSAEIMLFLISEEMKNRRHVNRLVEVGFDAAYTCDLSTLILSLGGFDERSDGLYEWYNELLNAYCEKTSPADAAAWKEAAFDMYMEIRTQKT
jgi:hypothetical protein